MNPHRSRSRSAGNIPLSAAHHILVAHDRVNHDAHPRRAPVSDMRRAAHHVNHLVAVTLVYYRHTLALNPHISLHLLPRAVDTRVAARVLHRVHRQHRRIDHHHGSILAVPAVSTVSTRLAVRSRLTVNTLLAVAHHSNVTLRQHLLRILEHISLNLQRLHIVQTPRVHISQSHSLHTVAVLPHHVSHIFHVAVAQQLCRIAHTLHRLSLDNLRSRRPCSRMPHYALAARHDSVHHHIRLNDVVHAVREQLEPPRIQQRLLRRYHTRHLLPLIRIPDRLPRAVLLASLPQRANLVIHRDSRSRVRSIILSRSRQFYHIAVTLPSYLVAHLHNHVTLRRSIRLAAVHHLITVEHPLRNHVVPIVSSPALRLGKQLSHRHQLAVIRRSHSHTAPAQHPARLVSQHTHTTVRQHSLAAHKLPHVRQNHIVIQLRVLKHLLTHTNHHAPVVAVLQTLRLDSLHVERLAQSHHAHMPPVHSPRSAVISQSVALVGNHPLARSVKHISHLRNRRAGIRKNGSATRIRHLAHLRTRRKKLSARHEIIHVHVALAVIAHVQVEALSANHNAVRRRRLGVMHTVHHNVAQLCPALSVKPHLAVAQLQPLHKAYQSLRRIIILAAQKLLHTAFRRKQIIIRRLSRVPRAYHVRQSRTLRPRLGVVLQLTYAVVHLIKRTGLQGVADFQIHLAWQVHLACYLRHTALSVALVREILFAHQPYTPAYIQHGVILLHPHVVGRGFIYAYVLPVLRVVFFHSCQ